MTSFVQELKRRNVLRVGAAYLIASWLILQIVDVVFPMLGIDESLGRPILSVLALGFPAALIFSWSFELTPQGLKKEKNVDRSKSVTSQTGRKLDRIIIVILISAIGMLLVDKFIIQNPPGTAMPVASNLDSVAVLPFVNMSGAAENEYFSDGLTETLLHMLAQVPDLKVAARTSAFAYKGKDADIRQIANSLGVATILEGSVQRSGQTVRITAQLIQADSGFHLWSRTFDRNLDDIFTVQDEIATSVANALQSTLMGDAPGKPVVLAGIGTTSTAAYEKFLRGLEQKNIGSYSTFPQAEGLFKEALAIDPQFVEAKLELVDTYNGQAGTGLITAAEYRLRSRPLLEQVIAANPKHGRALGYLAYIDLQESFEQFGIDPVTALPAIEKMQTAISLAPNESDLYAMMSEISMGLRSNDEALEWLGRGIVVDPLSAELYWQRASLLQWRMRDPVAAEESLARARELAPEWTAVYTVSADVARARGEFAEALRWELRAMELDPRDHEIPATIARYFYRLGLVDEGDEMLRRAQSLAPQAPFTRSVGLERQLLAGNYERAILLAESMIRDDVEDRGGAWGSALFAYVVAKIELGRAADVPIFLESVTPGIASTDYATRGFRDQLARFFVVAALAEEGNYDEANAILDPLVAWFDANSPGFGENHGALSNVALIRGDNQVAIDQALQDLEEPLGRNMGWRIAYEQSTWRKPLLRDERIAKRLAELNVETQAAADEVREMLASRDGV